MEEEVKNSPPETVSSAASFRRHAHSQVDIERDKRIAEAEIVSLPSGLKIKLYRPGPLWWLRHRGIIPQTLLARLGGEDPEKQTMSHAQLVEYSIFVDSLLQEMVLEPKVSLNPKDNEISPYDIGDDDLQFIMRYGVGETVADGQSLAAFPE